MLLGISIRQEYVCVAAEDAQDPKIYISGIDNDVYEISSMHLFLGYKPVIIAIFTEKKTALNKWLSSQVAICFSITHRDFSINLKWRGFNSDRRCLAQLALEKIKVKSLENTEVFFFTGIYGEHKFSSPFHQFIGRIVERYFSKRDHSNIDLNENLYDQVRIAYCVSRLISIITVSDGSKINMFPTDLHGPINRSFYISSLRHGGKANEQVETLKRLALSKVSVDWCKKTYALGKNHMHELSSLENFSTATVQSDIFSIPLPEAVMEYFELEQFECFDVGVHRIHLYHIRNRKKVQGGKTLAHIHRSYAEWRINRKMPTNILEH